MVRRGVVEKEGVIREGARRRGRFDRTKDLLSPRRRRVAFRTAVPDGSIAPFISGDTAQRLSIVASNKIARLVEAPRNERERR